MSKIKYKDVQAAHEARMWIKDVIIPSVTALVVIDRVNPSLKYSVKQKIENTKTKITNLFKKEA